MACWNPSTSHTNRGLQEWPVGIPLPQIPIEDFRNGLLESFYLTYQYGTTRIAFWNPSTSNTNRRVQEWPAGIHLPHLLALIIGLGYSFIIHSKYHAKNMSGHICVLWRYRICHCFYNFSIVFFNCSNSVVIAIFSIPMPPI